MLYTPKIELVLEKKFSSCKRSDEDLPRLMVSYQIAYNFKDTHTCK